MHNLGKYIFVRTSVFHHSRGSTELHWPPAPASVADMSLYRSTSSLHWLPVGGLRRYDPNNSESNSAAEKGRDVAVAAESDSDSSSATVLLLLPSWTMFGDGGE
jgi:hypothetical protein